MVRRALKIKYFPALILLFFSSVQAQINHIPGYGSSWTRGGFDSVLSVPNGLGRLRINANSDNSTQIRYNPVDSSFYAWTGSQWLKQRGGIGSSLEYSNTTNKYLNGYGNWVYLHADSITGGTNHKFYHDTLSRAAFSVTNTGNSAASYNSTTGVFNIARGWNILGNAGTVDTNFIGTTDNKSLLFRTNNVQKLKLDSSGNLYLTNFTNVPHTRLFRIGSDDGDSTMVFNVSSSSNIRSSLTLKPNGTGFTADGSGSNFGPLKIVSSYQDSIYSMGAYKSGMYIGANGFKFNIPASGISMFSVEKSSVPVMMVRSDSSLYLGDTTYCRSCAMAIRPSTPKGVAFPRVTNTQMNAIASPATGLILFNDSYAAFFFYNGAGWRKLTDSSGANPPDTTGVISITKGAFIDTAGGATIIKTGTIKVDTAALFRVTPKFGYGDDTAVADRRFNFKEKSFTSDNASAYTFLSRTSSIAGKYTSLATTPTSISLGRYSSTAQAAVNTSNDSAIILHAAGVGFAHDLTVNAKYVQITKNGSITTPVKIIARLDSVTNDGKYSVFMQNDTLKMGKLNTGTGGPGVDSIKAINDSTIRAFNHVIANNDIILVKDSLVILGEVTGKGMDTVNTLLATTIATDHTLTGVITINGNALRPLSGFQTNTSSTGSNIYTTSGASIMTITAANYLPGSLAGIGMRVGESGSTSGTLSAGYGYANHNIGEAPVTLPTSGTTPFLTQLLLNDLGTVTNASIIRVNKKTGLYIPKFAASSYADTLAGIVNDSKSYFNDTVRITTVDTSQNNTIAASTKFVHDLIKGISGGGITTIGTISAASNTKGADISGSTLTLHPATDTTGGIVTSGTQAIGGSKTFSGTLIASGGMRSGAVSTNSSFVVFGSASAVAQTATQYIYGTATTNYAKVGIYGSTTTAIPTGNSYSGLFIAGAATTATGLIPNISTVVMTETPLTGGSVTERSILYMGPTSDYSIIAQSGIAWFKTGISAGTGTFASDIVANGIKAGSNGITSSTFFGNTSGVSTTGANNTFIGNRSGKFTTSGTNNAFLGFTAGESVTTGIYNTAVGSAALLNSSTGANNTAIGGLTGYNTNGSYNTFLGYNATLSASTSNGSNYDNTIFILNKNGHDSVASTTSLTGINTTAPTSTVSINGSVSHAYRQVSATTTATATDYEIDAISGTYTINLPTAVGCQGRVYIISNAGTGTITVDGSSTEPLDGSTTKVLNTQYSQIQIMSTGSATTGWRLIK